MPLIGSGDVAEDHKYIYIGSIMPGEHIFLISYEKTEASESPERLEGYTIEKKGEGERGE